jgi:hypothetical protein
MTNKQKFIVCPCGSEKFTADTIYHTTVNICTDGSWNPIENSFGLVRKCSVPTMRIGCGRKKICERERVVIIPPYAVSRP